MAGRSIEAGRAFMRLTLDDDAFQKGIKGVSRKMNALGKSISGFGAKFLGLGAGLAAPLTAAVKVAADSQETFSKFDTVFGDASGAVRDFGNTLAAEVGRSETEIGGFLAGFQDLLVPIGIDPAKAQETSKLLTQLAVDMASFNNKADADTVRDLQAALTGSGEVMKKYGVIVSEAAVKQQLLTDGIDPATAKEQDKVFARTAIILAGTTAAQGDAVRTAGQLTNRIKGLGGAVKDFGVEVGKELLQPLADIAGVATAAVKQLRAFAAANKGIVTALAVAAGGALLFGGALVGLGLSFSIASAALAGFGTVMGVVVGAINLALSPFGLLVIGVGAAAAAFLRFTESGAALVDLMKSGFAELLDIVGDTFGLIVHRLQGGDIIGAGQALFAGLKVVFLKGVAEVASTLQPLASGLVDVWQVATGTVIVLMSQISAVWARVVAGMQQAWNGFSKGVVTAWKGTQATITEGILKAQKFITEAITGEEFDISVELDQNAKALSSSIATLKGEYEATRAAIKSNLEADLAANLQNRGDALDILAERGNQLQAGINSQLEGAEQAAKDSRAALAEMAKGARGVAEETKKSGGGLLESVQGAVDGIKAGLDANVSTEGTFRGATAALQFGPAASTATQQLAVAKQQLDKQDETVAAIKDQDKGLAVTP